ncbi:hypothetical protein FOL47_005844 [Perkinsus chesapeaki]|uniref:EF-hand domain-containing protein n=1 Tax=Perkinsus chesapeaki TaxID=330153 RepID=A0A7J6LVA9_PERCH|nr:hypothetical protein FOL47_005844 [Perkinsus chesapeaki]
MDNAALVPPGGARHRQRASVAMIYGHSPPAQTGKRRASHLPPESPKHHDDVPEYFGLPEPFSGDESKKKSSHALDLPSHRDLPRKLSHAATTGNTLGVSKVDADPRRLSHSITTGTDFGLTHAEKARRSSSHVDGRRASGSKYRKSSHTRGDVAPLPGSTDVDRRKGIARPISPQSSVSSLVSDDSLIERLQKDRAWRHRKENATYSLAKTRFKNRKFLDQLFFKYDPNGDGTGSLGVDETFALFQEAGLNLSRAEVKDTMKQIDLDGNGTVEIEEFHFFFNRAANRQELKTAAKDLFTKIADSSDNFDGFIKKVFSEYAEPLGPSGKAGTLYGVTANNFHSLQRLLHLGLNKEDSAALFAKFKHPSLDCLDRTALARCIEDVKQRNELKERLVEKEPPKEDFLRNVFEQFDTSRTGNMSEDDLCRAVKFMELDISSDGVRDLLRAMDTDENGTVEIDEFFAFFKTVKDIGDMKRVLAEFEIRKENKNALNRVLCGVTSLSTAVLLVVTLTTNNDATRIGLFLSAGALVMSLFFLLYESISRGAAGIWALVTVKRCLVAAAAFLILLIIAAIIGSSDKSSSSSNSYKTVASATESVSDDSSAMPVLMAVSGALMGICLLCAGVVTCAGSGKNYDIRDEPETQEP